MEKRKANSLMPHYRFADPSLWTGRKTTKKDGVQYWYQQVQCITDPGLVFSLPPHRKKLGFIGYACEEGVRRNQGRVGTKQGPGAIRQQLAKLAFHHHELAVVDFGNAVCNDENMEACQEQLANMVEQLIADDYFPFVLGGGHDIAFGHFMGLQKALPENQRIAIVNFDAHFDLRPVVERGNSGTPFNQIRHNHSFQQLDYVAIGIQAPANTKSLFDIAKEQGVHYFLSEDCHLANLSGGQTGAGKIKNKLQSIFEDCDQIYITIDLDGFSSAYAPGVSATSPMGFDPYFVMDVLADIFKTGKVVSCDIAELNPRYDQDNATAKLAARLIDFCCGLLA